MPARKRTWLFASTTTSKKCFTTTDPIKVQAKIGKILADENDINFYFTPTLYLLALPYKFGNRILSHFG